MSKEVSEQPPTSTEPEEAVPYVAMDIGVGDQQRVAHLPFDDAIALLLGVHVRRVRRQPLNEELPRVLGDKVRDGLASVCLEAIPDDDERLPHLATEVPQRGDYLCPMDGATKVTCIEAGSTMPCRRYECRNRGNFASSTAYDCEPRGMTDWRPCSGDIYLERCSHFIDEDDGCASTRSPLFIRGQSRWSQASISASSRSLGLVVGHCGEKPISCRTLLRELGW